MNPKPDYYITTKKEDLTRKGFQLKFKIMSMRLNDAIRIECLVNQMNFKITMFKGHTPSIKEIAL